MFLTLQEFDPISKNLAILVLQRARGAFEIARFYWRDKRFLKRWAFNCVNCSDLRYSNSHEPIYRLFYVLSICLVFLFNYELDFDVDHCFSYVHHLGRVK